jgi:hypothetical protein
MCSIDGRPGFFKEAAEFLSEKCEENPLMYGQCSLMVDEVHIRYSSDWEKSTASDVGFVDIGDGPDRKKGVATKALVFMCVGLVGNWKLPVGYYLVNSKSFHSCVIRYTISLFS